MYTCQIPPTALLSANKVTILANITYLVAHHANATTYQLALLIAEECVSLSPKDNPSAFCTCSDTQVTVRNAGGNTLMIISKVTQEPVPALLIVDSMNNEEGITASSSVFPDTTEGMAAALDYIKELRESEDSSATIATIYRLIYNAKEHTYLPEEDHVQQIQF